MFGRTYFMPEKEAHFYCIREICGLGATSLHDLRQLPGHAIYNPDDYGEAQQLGYALREAKSYGVYYQSVREEGECYGVMRPRALSDAVHWRYLRYHYDQGSIVKVESLDGSDRR